MTDRENKLRYVLSQYYKEDATTSAVVAMYNAIDATTAVLTKEVDTAARIGVAQMLFDMSTGLATNPFMMQYGSRMAPVFQAAVNAYLDHLDYYDEDQKSLPHMDTGRTMDIRSRILTCSYVKHEIALAALLCEQGGAALRSMSRRLRDALIEMENT